MYQNEICLVLLGIAAGGAIICVIQQKMYLNWLMTGKYKIKSDKKNKINGGFKK